MKLLVKHQPLYWLACNIASVLLCVVMAAVSAYYILQSGYWPNAALPFCACTGLWLSFFLAVILGLASFSQLISMPVGKMAFWGSVVIAVITLALLVFCTIVVSSAAAYFQLANHSVYIGI